MIEAFKFKPDLLARDRLRKLQDTAAEVTEGAAMLKWAPFLVAFVSDRIATADNRVPATAMVILAAAIAPENLTKPACYAD